MSGPSQCGSGYHDDLMVRLPLKITAPLVMSVPVLVAVIVLAYLAISQARATANDLAAQNLEQIHERIRVRVDDLLTIPRRLGRVNRHMIRSGQLDPRRLRAWLPTLHEESIAFGMLSTICWGSPDGRAVWIARYPGMTTYEFAVKDHNTADKIEIFNLDAEGAPPTRPSDSYGYSPLVRPWYTAAVEAGKATWTPVYAWVPKKGAAPALGVGYTQPVRDAEGGLIGVIDAEVTLHDLSVFLSSLKVGRTGRAFIVDADGIIAGSSHVKVTDEKYRRVAAKDCGDPHIAAAAAVLDRAPPTLDIDGEKNLLRVSVYRNLGLKWSIATLVPESDFMGGVVAGRRRAILAGILAVVVTIGLGVFLAVRLVRPIVALAGHAHRIGEGDLDTTIHLTTSPELQRLSDEMNAMTAGLKDRMRMRDSLELAMDVQQALLPSSDPQIAGLDIAGHSTYCDETGGDYYDFLDVTGIEESTGVVAVGDVMGHGVAAALMMATAQGILRSRSRETDSLADLLTHMNDLISAQQSDRFMTMLLMRIDAKRGELRYAAAGHEPPLVYDPEKERFLDLRRGQMALGLMEGVTYREQVVDGLAPGTVIFAATDGVSESRNSNDELFGDDRTRESIRKLAQHPAAKIRKLLLCQLAIFVGDARPDDDVTFVVVKVSGAAAPS